MRVHKAVSRASFLFLVVSALLLGSRATYAHCDGLDGPVVTAARDALETGDVNRVLIWVGKEDEAEIRRAFEETMAVRVLSEPARELADRYFFETLVRVHRAGEGAPYTGLKPAGRDLGPAIPAADRALETGSLEPLRELLTEEVREGLDLSFERARGRTSFDPDDVAAGRDYVGAYVVFVHYVERVFEAAKSEPHGHFAPPAHREQGTDEHGRK